MNDIDKLEKKLMINVLQKLNEFQKREYIKFVQSGKIKCPCCEKKVKELIKQNPNLFRQTRKE